MTHKRPSKPVTQLASMPLRVSPEGLILLLWIQPGASRSQWMGLYGDPPRYKVSIAAPPVEGAANEELLRFLKKQFGFRASALSLVRGHQSRQKDVLIQELTIQDWELVLSSSVEKQKRPKSQA